MWQRSKRDNRLKCKHQRHFFKPVLLDDSKLCKQVAAKMLEKLNSCGDDFTTSYLHPLFGANNDSEMFSQMVWISFFYTLSVAVSMALFPAPYGKFSNLF
jgi:hypothetical protein